MNEMEAWRSFNTADNNEDPGGSWLYALRYSEADLRDHQSTVINVIKEMGITIHQLPEGGLYLGSDHDLPDEEVQKVVLMAEELTVTNEALEHSGLELHGSNLAKLADMYKVVFLSSIASGDKKTAGGMLRVEMPQLVSDLSRAQSDNEPLSEEDYQVVVDLGDFVASKTAILMSGDGIMILSNFGSAQQLTLEDLPENH